MWIKRIIGLAAIGVGVGVFMVLFLPLNVLFFIIAAGLLIFGINCFFG